MKIVSFAVNPLIANKSANVISFAWAMAKSVSPFFTVYEPFTPTGAAVVVAVASASACTGVTVPSPLTVNDTPVKMKFASSILLSLAIFSTVVPIALAMLVNVSPALTVYVSADAFTPTATVATPAVVIAVKICLLII